RLRDSPYQIQSKTLANSICWQTVVETAPSRALRHLSQQTFVQHKILFGTDYPVPFRVRYNSWHRPAQLNQVDRA
ncbi:MAG: hypothetical protein AB2720_00610, partial [Candidatus Thiodiazotropha taylori]